ncbi:opsin-2 [Daphnia magna]|uniref:opsin-2 n=1 Tax=Daphnia magna TaxID=35525 RepID=UPI001E1BCEB0|nr:opsin-2 [Daphnia magna]
MKEVNIHHSCSETNCTADEQITDAIICPWLEEYRWRHSAIIERWKLCGFFEDEDFLDINCHWLQFEPVPLINHLLLICLFIFILLAGCLCNFIVIYILASSRHLRTPANIIIMNLAVSDFLMLIKMPVFLYNSLLQGPALGSKGCLVYGFMSGLTGTTSIMSLAAIAIDRYLVISQPLNINRKQTRTRAYVTSCCIWFYSAIFASLPLFGIGKYVPEGYLTSCSFDYLSDDVKTRIFILVFFVAAWVVPFCTITGCYTAIVWYVRKARIELSHQQSATRNAAAGWRQSNIEVVIAKIVLGLVMMWMISWTPYALVALLGISGNQNRLTPGMTMLPALFAKCSACVNPIVYTLTHPKIKKEMLRRWYCLMASAASNGIVDASANGGGLSTGRHGPVWRQNSNSDVDSPMATRRPSMRSSLSRRKELVNESQESFYSRDQLMLANIPLHVRAERAQAKTGPSSNEKMETDETCLSIPTAKTNAIDAKKVIADSLCNDSQHNSCRGLRSVVSINVSLNINPRETMNKRPDDKPDVTNIPYIDAANDNV